MIEIINIPNEDRKRGCDNCNRAMKPILKYNFWDQGAMVPYNELSLCEDCSGAIGMLRTKCLAEGKNFIYDKDEIQEIEGEENE